MAKQNNNAKTRFIIFIIASVLLLFAGFIPTLAKMVAKTPPVSNNFEPGKIVIQAQTDGEYTTAINTTQSDVGAYIRAAIVVNYQDYNDNSIYHEGAIEGVDYDVIPSSDWIKGSDGFYYYVKPVAVGESTTVLPQISRNILPGDDNKQKYQLVSTYVFAGVQSNVDVAVTTAWGVTLDQSGNIITVP